MHRFPAARLPLSCFLIAVAALAGAIIVEPRQAAAQQTIGPAMSPDEIAACLCQKQALEQQRASLDAQGTLLQERQLELSNLDTEIKRQSAALSSSDAVAQQIALRNLIQLQIRPSYNQQVGALTQVIETYNAQCTTRPRYKLDVDRAEQNLTCPQP
jgi:hypothetical protein